MQTILDKSILIQQRKDLPITGEALRALPCRILQFGNGVLLRGLPDYYVDQANKNGVFNGLIVVVKTTDGNLDDFRKQDYLYTHSIKGYLHGEVCEKIDINASIHKVLAASEDWEEILTYASDPAVNIIISNTTEQGIVYVEEKIRGAVPQSYPGKLLAYLFQRHLSLGPTHESKVVVLPTELVDRNGDKLKTILAALAEYNGLSADFRAWLRTEVTICNTLVDRIVSGKPVAEKLANYFAALKYQDQYLIESEPFNLWAIEGPSALKETLRFSKGNDGVKIVDDIAVYKELKLRLLNATHTFCAGVALSMDLPTVAVAMKDPLFIEFVTTLMTDIQESITSPIADEEKAAFASSVLDRFQNPHIQHFWSAIIFSYSEKFLVRCMPLITAYYRLHGQFSPSMVKGFAAYFRVAIPDAVVEDTYYATVNGVQITLNDPKSKELLELKQQHGIAATIQQQLNSFFSPNEDTEMQKLLVQSVLADYLNLVQLQTIS